jgi:hypothetical protein
MSCFHVVMIRHFYQTFLVYDSWIFQTNIDGLKFLVQTFEHKMLNVMNYNKLLCDKKMSNSLILF